MRSLSVSALKAYLLCPRKFRYMYVDHLPSDAVDRNRKFALSNILHAALTDFHSRRSIEWADLDRSLLGQWDASLFADIHASAAAYHKARWMLWDAFASIASPDVASFGYSFETNFGGGKFRGRIDRIDDEGDTLVLVDYVLGDHVDEQGLKICAAIASKVFKKPVRAIRVIRLGFNDGDADVAVESATGLENDIARLRRAMDADTQYQARPAPHCLTCPYVQICDSAYEKEHTPGRANELFRLFAGMEILMNIGESADSFRRGIEVSIRRLDSASTIVWLDGIVLSEDLEKALVTMTEFQGNVVVADGRASIAASDSFSVPVAKECLAVFPETVSRMAAEIFGRTLRIASSRAANFRAATTDGLTGLFRREVCEGRLEEERDASFAFILCDIDRFKGINDKFGHAAGDEALRIVTKILRSRSDAVGYRMGGEEFLLLVPDDSPSYAMALAEAVRAEIEAASFVDNGHAIALTASFGIALSKKGEGHFEALKRADEALYCAKEQGRNRVIVAP